MKPSNEQAQGLYRLCYRLTNFIYPGWQYKPIELEQKIQQIKTNNLGS